ncbi:hypothetical protein VTO42DRAFT_81 [Malbranchea cinnamomea]
MEPPLKKQKKVLLSDSSDESGDETADLVNGQEFKINEEYARRFEHNKKREELQRLEEKLGKKSVFAKKSGSGEDDDSEEETESSESETEDDEGVLVTEALDAEIMATLNAIRSKDPRVYDKNATFYTPFEETEAPETTKSKEPKPMYLRDYHRENLLKAANGEVNEEEEEEEEKEKEAPKTYVQEQEELKQSIIREMHAAVDEEGEQDDDEDAFLVRKEKPEKPVTEVKKITEEDVAAADKDPETFLSNFMAARAWVPTEQPNLHPFESDDDDEEARAEAFEEAYNFRFEDPNKINETLITHARDTSSKFSVRKEKPSSRKKKREAERRQREEEKRQREEERARLRKLKIEQLEEKVAKIKQAAGIKTSDIPDEDWARFLEEGWDDAKFDEEMRKRFGDEYYAAREDNADEEDEDGAGPSKKKRKLKKPEWDDDIDIKDLVPDFDDGEEMNAGGLDKDEDEEIDDADDEQKPKKTKKDLLREKKEKQKEAKAERRRIEQIVDQNLAMEPSLLPGSSKKFSGTFRYRETSPTSFGLTARDILFADDAALNRYAGLKKLATFRDPAKKKKDRKHLGKKARLRQWRLETFGNEDGPQVDVLETTSTAQAEEKAGEEADSEMKVDIREGKKKRKRKRSKKH